MKKALSILLAMIIIISSLSGSIAYCATKPYAEDKLVEVQKKTGFVPGKTAKITGNCYGFISAVCEKLHGVKYDGEGLYGNYRARHETGNYYTVKIFETKSTTMTESIAEDIRDFFIENAQAGDVVHYGAYTKGTSNYSTHTLMIQHIDREKMQIYHSNYETRLDARNDCHIDTIIWDSFVKNPTKTIYNSDDTVYSFNSMFYLKMKSTGLGISINRLTNYKNKYQMVDNSADEVVSDNQLTAENKAPDKVTGLVSTSASATSIAIKWNKVDNAEKYYIQIKNNTKGTTFDKTVQSTSTSLNNLTENNSYTIKVRAINSNGKGLYSNAITVVAKSVTPKVTKLSSTNVTVSTISYSWTAVKNATKYHLDIKNITKGGNYEKDVTTNSATIKGLTEGNIYSVRVRAYTKAGGWGSYCTPIEIATKPAKVTGLSVTSPSTTKIRVIWNEAEGNKTGYQVWYSSDKNFAKDVVKKTVTTMGTRSNSAMGFKKGKTYYVKVRAYVKHNGVVRYGSWSSIKSIKCK